MEQGDVMLGERVVVLERQISMFERMVHMLSNNLDDHFKRYDMIIIAQQQQISDLNAVVSTLLNDQNRQAEVLREKLSGALHGISSTAASVNETIHSIPRLSNRAIEPDSFFGEILGAGGPAGVKQKVNQSMHNPVPYDQRFNETNDNDGNNDNDNDNQMGSDAMKQTDPRTSGGHVGDERPFGASMISYEDFSPLNNPHGHPRGASQSTNPSSMSEHPLYPNPSGAPNPAAPGVSNEPHQPHHESNGDVEGGLTEEQYLTVTGRKRKRSLFVGNFQFLKSPHSVMDVWKEYTEGINGQPSIKEMELIYQTGWRRDPAVNKRYSRRKVLCKAIETGLAKGYALEYTVNLLEDYRFIDREKGLKQPIGWLCQGHNIPDLLR